MRANSILRAFLAAFLVSASACGVSAEDHARNLRDANDYAADLAKCRSDARAAKKLGGDYETVYEACAEKADLRHGVIK